MVDQDPEVLPFDGLETQSSVFVQGRPLGDLVREPRIGYRRAFLQLLGQAHTAGQVRPRLSREPTQAPDKALVVGLQLFSGEVLVLKVARDVDEEEPALDILGLGDRHLVLLARDLGADVVKRPFLPFVYSESLGQALLDDSAYPSAGNHEDVVNVGAQVADRGPDEFVILHLAKHEDAWVQGALVEGVVLPVDLEVDPEDAGLEVLPPLPW